MSKTWKELVESGEAELIDGKPSFKGDPETAMISNPTEKMAAWWAFKLLEDFNKSKPE